MFNSIKKFVGQRKVLFSFLSGVFLVIFLIGIFATFLHFRPFIVDNLEAKKTSQELMTVVEFVLENEVVEYVLDPYPVTAPGSGEVPPDKCEFIIYKRGSFFNDTRCFVTARGDDYVLFDDQARQDYEYLREQLQPKAIYIVTADPQNEQISFNFWFMESSFIKTEYLIYEKKHGLGFVQERDEEKIDGRGYYKVRIDDDWYYLTD